MAETIEGREEASKAFLANMSPRAIRNDAMERWAFGRQYEGKPSWWDDEQPLWDRAPCIVYPIVAIAAQSNVDLVFGEGRFPDFTSRPAEPDAEEDGDDDGTDAVDSLDGLDEADSAALDRFLNQYHKRSKFRSHCRAVLRGAQTARTVCALHGVRNGRPFQELIPAKFATPEFDVDGNVVKLTIQYPYIEEYQTPGGSWAERAMLYRREIDTESDKVFKPALAQLDGRPPVWKVATDTKHGLGCCPVVWYRFMQEGPVAQVIDGNAIHELVTDEIQAHDIALSQRHRCALMSEPQYIEIGVAAGYSPTEVGRTALVATTADGGPVSASNPIRGQFYSTGQASTKPARRKGPGYPWQYDDPNVEVKCETIPSDALKAQSDNADDLRVKIQETLGVVTIDLENMRHLTTLSGKTLEALKQRQLDRCDQYRDDVEENFLLPSISIQLRIAVKLGLKLRVPGIAKALPVLKTFLAEAQAGGGADEWIAPDITLRWGPYFKPDPADDTAVINMVRAALGQGATTDAYGGTASSEPLITKRMALEKIASIFGIENVDAALEQIEDEKAENEQKAQDKLMAQQKLMAQSAPPDDKGKSAPGASKSDDEQPTKVAA